jgi:hypothetical protein
MLHWQIEAAYLTHPKYPLVTQSFSREAVLIRWRGAKPCWLLLFVFVPAGAIKDGKPV